MEQLTKHTQQIVEMIDVLKKEFIDTYGNLPWANDVSERVFAYSQKGKLLRGALVILGAEIVFGFILALSGSLLAISRVRRAR